MRPPTPILSTVCQYIFRGSDAQPGASDSVGCTAGGGLSSRRNRRIRLMLTESWLITGASGQLGGHLLRRLAAEDPQPRILALAGQGSVLPGVAAARIDLRNRDELKRTALEFRPTHILHVGALTSVTDAYQRPYDARRINTEATGVLVCAAAECAARLVFVSTDMVFDGRQAPYSEIAPTDPPSEYGRSKAAAERLLARCERALVVRVPLMYGFPCTPRPSTFVQQITALRERQPLRLFTDEYRSPVWVADAARALIALARSGLCDGPRRPRAGHDGIIHVAGPERLSRYEMGVRFARLLGIPDPVLEPVSRLSFDAAEPRPADLSLSAERFARLFPELTPGPIRAAVFAGLPGA